MGYGIFSFLEGKEDQVRCAEIVSRYHNELSFGGEGARNRGFLLTRVKVK